MNELSIEQFILCFINLTIKVCKQRPGFYQESCSDVLLVSTSCDMAEGNEIMQPVEYCALLIAYICVFRNEFCVVK